jgi:uncharacterized pyridoxamine 5'-phosphate oxidase family protein
MTLSKTSQTKTNNSHNRVWNSERVSECIRIIEETGDAPMGGTPFHEGDPSWKAADIVYEYSEFELQEIARCAADVVYFANNYCMAMTDYGIQKITLRPYQEDVLRSFQDNRFNVFLASRQIGKTVTSAIFITWYLLFNVDKNVIVLANKGATAAEILDKIKSVFKGLPFFLKPGIVTNNVMTMKFDNGCRVMGQATTKTAAIGFTIHLAYMDEFAHIQPSFIEPFYRSVYPTIAASQISRVIITSTPNGRNKFFEIYNGAVEKKNEYTPIRVDWWQVPGRDEKWKAREIANLGSEELFNQEYGNQFLAGDTLLLGGDALRAMKKIVRNYKWDQIQDFEYSDLDYKSLKWDPNFSFYDIDTDDKFVLSIDIADGAGKDYSVINIFKVEKMSKAAIRKLRRDRIESEASFFRLRQVGMYRSNKSSAEELSKISEVLIFKFFDPDNVRVSLEINFKGDYFIEKISKNAEYYEDIFLHTRHNEKTKTYSLGIKLHKHNKMFFCREFRKLVMEKRIILNEQVTFEEMNDFGINNKGTYSSQSGHDDVAMSCVNLVPMFQSDTFSDIVEEMYDLLEEDTKDLIQKRLAEAEIDKDDSTFSFLKNIL